VKFTLGKKNPNISHFLLLEKRQNMSPKKSLDGYFLTSLSGEVIINWVCGVNLLQLGLPKG
jgi:hypothetical protein